MKQPILTRHLFPVLIVLVVSFGLLVRLWRLDFGMELPYLAHTDEPTQYNPAVRILRTGDLNPHFFNYPSLTIYIHALVLYVGYWVGSLFGVFHSWAEVQPIRTLEMAVGIVGTPELLLLGRATTATIGGATVLVAWAWAKHLTQQRWAPLLAALLLALSPAHIRLSHYMTVDVVATFFAAACLAACTAAVAQKSRRLLWLAAICGGLATSSKYNYGLLVVPVFLAIWLDAASEVGDKLARTFIGGVLFCLAFVLTSPFVLLDAGPAFEAIQSEMQHYASGHQGFEGNSLTWYLRYLWEVNPIYVLLGPAGLLWACWRKPRASTPALVFALSYLWLIGRQQVHFDRNVLPLMVTLIVGAAVAVDAVAGWLRGWLGHKVRLNPIRWGASAATVALVCIPWWPSLTLLPHILRPAHPSGKAMAQAWFARAAQTPYGQQALTKGRPTSVKIIGESYTVCLDPQRHDVRYVTNMSDPKLSLANLEAQGYDIVMLGSGMFNRFYREPEVYARQVRAYDTLFQVPDQVAFVGEYDPLEFIPDGTRVYVLFLTEKGRLLRAAVEESGYTW